MDRKATGPFLREARLLPRRNHPNFCRIDDLVEGENTKYLAQAFAEGVPLRRLDPNFDDPAKRRTGVGIGIDIGIGIEYPCIQSIPIAIAIPIPIPMILDIVRDHHLLAYERAAATGRRAEFRSGIAIRPLFFSLPSSGTELFAAGFRTPRKNSWERRSI